LCDLIHSNEHDYYILGFVNNLPTKRKTMIDGRQILGSLNNLPIICRRWQIEQILIAIPRLAPTRLQQVLDTCADLKLSYKILPAFAYLKTGAATVLQDLAPRTCWGVARCCSSRMRSAACAGVGFVISGRPIGSRLSSGGGDPRASCSPTSTRTGSTSSGEP
jgi:hypothetical protein